MRAFVDLAEKLEQIVCDHHPKTLSRQESNDLMVAVAFLREIWDASDVVDRYIGEESPIPKLHTPQEEAAYGAERFSPRTLSVSDAQIVECSVASSIHPRSAWP